MVPQTVNFTLRLHFNHINRLGTGKPETVDVEFNSFDEMIQRYGKERRRRAYADRCTSAEYRMNLTDHGRSVCAADEYRRKSHQDAIDGTWFKM